MISTISRSNDRSKSPDKKSKTPAQDRLQKYNSRDSRSTRDSRDSRSGYKTPAQDRLKRQIQADQELPRLTQRERQSCIPYGKWTDQRVRLNKQKENQEKLRIKKAREEGQTITVRTSNSSSSSNKTSSSSVAQDEIEHDTRREISHKMKFKLVDGTYIPTNDPEAQAGPSRRTFSDRINEYVFVNGRMMTLPQAAVYLDGLERDRLEGAGGNSGDESNGGDENTDNIKVKQQSKKDLRKKHDDKDRNKKE